MGYGRSWRRRVRERILAVGASSAPGVPAGTRLSGWPYGPRTMRRLGWGVTLAVLLAACSGDDSGEGAVEQAAITTATSTTTGQSGAVLVSGEGASAMQAAEDAIGQSDSLYDPLAIATVSKCRSISEFVQALHDVREQWDSPSWRQQRINAQL
jgi:hypothetical protein